MAYAPTPHETRQTNRATRYGRALDPLKGEPKPDERAKAEKAIKAVAARAAWKGLRLAHAQALFDALIVADAVALERGNCAAAADRLGIERATIHRMINRRAKDRT